MVVSNFGALVSQVAILNPKFTLASEFFITGTLKTWSIVEELHRITVPTLVVNGRYDEAQDECVEPYFWNIPKVKWFRFAESSHVSPRFYRSYLHLVCQVF